MSKFERVSGVNDVPNLGRISVVLDDEIPALLIRVDDAYYCVEDVCTHDSQPLTDGELSGEDIICPRHGASFNIRTGAPTAMPATEPIRVFPVDVRVDGIYVQID
ncbi:Rieske 2Fe-2S domain-containing protein [Planctomicrobium sp. SH668]|uniref:Rieske 2Fe-2S domain-containing protein n=1 Tax=Planctomicrobium sp. SH668 TaxID=3448126 RepID=UPI003F5C0E61